MFVFIEGPFEGEVLVVVPYFYLGIVWAGDDERFAGMDDDCSNEIVVRLEILHLFHRVVVEHAHVEIVRTADNPVFAADEFDGADGEGRCLKGANAGLAHGIITLLE
jgi:hypothetical protein